MHARGQGSALQSASASLPVPLTRQQEQLVTVWGVRCLQAVQLVPLPEGVPEVLDVTCNGRSGKLLVRTQRVLHCDAEMSASKFEQVCGKGDAKKWKSSIWTEDADGQQDVVCILSPVTVKVFSNNLLAHFLSDTRVWSACFLPSAAVHIQNTSLTVKAVLQLWKVADSKAHIRFLKLCYCSIGHVSCIYTCLPWAALSDLHH